MMRREGATIGPRKILSELLVSSDLCLCFFTQSHTTAATVQQWKIRSTNPLTGGRLARPGPPNKRGKFSYLVAILFFFVFFPVAILKCLIVNSISSH